MEDNYTWEKICGALEREYQRVIDRFKQTRRKKK
jgi:hypothetical protein